MANLKASGQRPASRHPLAEVRRLRAELAEALRERDEARGALIAYPDPFTDASLRQVAAAAYDGGYDDGFRDGYLKAEADQRAAWAPFARRVASPERYERERADRAVRSAEAQCRRDAAQHEREFVARAYATAPDKRNDVQQATVLSCPPPDQRGPAHLRVVGDG